MANHTSHMDTPLILCSLPDDWRRRTAVAAAADYFFDTWWRATGSAVAFNTFPIERRGGTLSSTPGDLLGSGWNVVVFPEGTRSPDGWTRPFRLGAAYLAAQYGVPVVPIGIRGSYAAMPRGRGWPVPGRPPVTVRFGEPIRQRPDEGVRELGARVERAVAQLVDEDASTWWEATATRRGRRDAEHRRTGRRPVASGLGPDPVAERRAAAPRSGTADRSGVGAGPGVHRDGRRRSRVDRAGRAVLRMASTGSHASRASGDSPSLS